MWTKHHISEASLYPSHRVHRCHADKYSDSREGSVVLSNHHVCAGISIIQSYQNKQMRCLWIGSSIRLITHGATLSDVISLHHVKHCARCLCLQKHLRGTSGRQRRRDKRQPHLSSAVCSDKHRYNALLSFFLFQPVFIVLHHHSLTQFANCRME